MLIKKVTILNKYLDFSNFFLKIKIQVLLKQIGINKYIINLVNNK